MAQERTRLLLGVLILLMKQLVDDPLNHRVSGRTFQSQALSCSPAVHGITCHSEGTKARMAISYPHREQLLGWYTRLLLASLSCISV